MILKMKTETKFEKFKRLASEKAKGNHISDEDYLFLKNYRRAQHYMSARMFRGKMLEGACRVVTGFRS